MSDAANAGFGEPGLRRTPLLCAEAFAKTVYFPPTG
jgi:hypothetical protein